MADSYADLMCRDEREAQRLGEQFDLLTRNIGYLLHPAVARTVPPIVRVADLVTGTGLFLKRLQEEYPRASLSGFDISPAMFPQPRPHGMALSVLDIKERVPEELRDQFDLVHVRQIAAAMDRNDWAPAVANAASLLREGGWLQWEECDFMGVKHMRGGLETSRVDTVRRLGRDFRDALLPRFEHGWSTLARDMHAAGLVSIATDMVSSDRLPETRAELTANGLRAILSWKRRLVPQQQQDMDTLERAAFEEVALGAYVRYDIHIVCGQKPVS